MRKSFLNAILLLISLNGFAATYYIDPAGNDNNNGTSASTAWKTLIKVNNTNFAPGDSILFIKGGVWTGAITVKNNGTSTNPITWGSYGAGANPLISGFIVASGWISAGKGIWTYNNPDLGSTIPAIVTINGSVQPLGRFPKTDGKFTSHTSTTAITDPALSNSPSFVGAEVVIRKNHWVNTIGKVTAQSSGTITYSSLSSTTPTDGFTYFFQNSLNCLTQFGDWCYNSSTNTLSMYFGAAMPSDYLIKVSSPIALFYINSKNYNTINGIDFEGANYAVQGNYNSSNTTISNCNINKIGNNAIDFIIAHNLVITGNTINDVNNTAVALYSPTYGCTVSSNTINRVGIIPGAGESDYGLNNEGANTGISIDNGGSYSNTVQYNTLNNIGYNGIAVNGDTYLIDGNYVNSACSILDDGAGIYTYTGIPAVVHKGRSITNNIVLNSIGNVPPGLYGPPDGLYQSNEAHGIYCDENSSDLTITGNTTANCGGYGVILSDSHEIVFNNNLSYNNSIGQIIIQYQNPLLTGVQKNLNINNNTFIANTSGQLALSFQSIASGSSAVDFTEFGSAGNNHYASLSPNTSIIKWELSEGSSTLTNLRGWKSLSSQEANSTFLDPNYISQLFQYNATNATKNISLNKPFIDIQSNSYTGVSLKPYSAIVLICIKGDL